MWIEGSPLAIVADDLTGACDTACQFSRYGLETVVTHYSRLNWDASVQVLAVNSVSRKESASVAYECTFEITRQLLAAGRIPFYKKLDSTLKGNWCSELLAMVRAYRPDIVLIAPAFPQWGRITENGIQYIHGLPVSEARLHHSQRKSSASGRTADVVQILRDKVGPKVQLIKRVSARKGSTYIERQIRTARSKGYPFLVFDAINDQDLKNICLAGCQLEHRVLWVGSAGMARFLPFGWGYHLPNSEPQAGPASVVGFATNPVLLINGSLNPSNAEQLSFLEEGRVIATVIVEEVDIADQNPTRQQKLDLSRRSMQQGIDVTLTIRLNKPIQSRSQLQGLHDTLLFLALDLIRSENIGGLIIVGGDTAMKIFHQIGATGIRVGGEVQPGIPYGSWIGGQLDDQFVVTKAGGFGKRDTLLTAMEFLRGGSFRSR